MENKSGTIVLGIETSCDETAASLVEGGRRILSSQVASQMDLHASFGGVVPEIASREHIKAILPVIEGALRGAGLGLHDLNAIAVTFGPGLVGALLVGISAAKGLAAATGLPLIPVHHLEGHIASAYLANPELEPPFLSLIVSGGHASLVEVVDYKTYRILGRTRDDAPGEAFDKIARTLGLGYPGGPRIEEAARGGDREAFDLPRPRFSDSFDFSFSGVKTAAINQYRKFMQEAQREGRDWPPGLNLQDFAATFQESVVLTLVEHSREALESTGYKDLALVGGVSANLRLRQKMEEMTQELGVRLTIPPLALCTDNAAMVASAGYYAWQAGRRGGLDLNALPMVELDEIGQVISGDPDGR